MSLEIYEPVLESCAQTGQIDYEQWPAILNPLLDRLNYIAHHDFPTPKFAPQPVLPCQRVWTSEPGRFVDNPPVVPSNAGTPNTPRTLPPVPPFPGTGTSHVSNSQTTPSQKDQDDENTPREPQLPEEVLQILNSSLQTLRTSFPEKPPHTIQRLSELVLNPKKHYRTLQSWLRALDRVVSVSSGADVFPLSDIPPNINNAMNGTDPLALSGANTSNTGGGIFFGAASTTGYSSNDPRNGYDRDALGSDESLGGALLTPIPWLRDTDLSSTATGSSSGLDSTSKVNSWQDSSPDDDDNDNDNDMLGEPISDASAESGTAGGGGGGGDGDGDAEQMAATVADAQAIAAVASAHSNGSMVPERPDGAVTQGELIRMEQEAGVVPVPHEDIHRIGEEVVDEHGMPILLPRGMGVDMEDEGDKMPHARGPDVVGTVDMGLVGGREREVRISSPPEERRLASLGGGHNVHDVPEVLWGGMTVDKEDSDKNASPSNGSDDFIQVSRDDAASSTPSKKAGSGPGSETSDDDGDIVLVDADGIAENKADMSEKEKRFKADEKGADSVDSSAQ